MTVERRKTRQIQVGTGRRRRRRADHRAVDDDHQDGRRRGHAAADLRAGRRRLRHRALHVQRARGGRGPGPASCPRSPVPIVADIHHQYKMALAALDAGVHCLRLNPGNIRKPEHIKLVAREAQGPRRPDPHRRQRRLARPRALRQVRRPDHARGDGRVGAAGARRTSTRSASTDQDLGEGVERAADDRGVPPAGRRHRPPAAPRRHRGRPAAGRAWSRPPPASPRCSPRASATRSATRSPPTRSRRRAPGAQLLEALGLARAQAASTSSPARRAAGPRST